MRKKHKMIQEVIREYPTYGYRRIWAILRFDKGVVVNKKKVQRIMRLKGWQAKPIKRPHRSTSQAYDEKRHTVVDPRERIKVSFPNLKWSTDLTKFYVEEAGWVNLIPVVDCLSRECVGSRISVRGRAREARDAQEAVWSQFRSIENIPNDLSFRMDNGSIFLAKEYWDDEGLRYRTRVYPYRCPSAN
jgi:putative transposase